MLCSLHRVKRQRPLLDLAQKRHLRYLKTSYPTVPFSESKETVQNRTQNLACADVVTDLDSNELAQTSGLEDKESKRRWLQNNAMHDEHICCSTHKIP